MIEMFELYQFKAIFKDSFPPFPFKKAQFVKFRPPADCKADFDLVIAGGSAVFVLVLIVNKSDD